MKKKPTPPSQQFTEKQWQATLSQHRHWATRARAQSVAVWKAFKKLDAELTDKLEREDNDAIQELDDLFGAYEWLDKRAFTCEESLQRMQMYYNEAKRNGEIKE